MRIVCDMVRCVIYIVSKTRRGTRRPLALGALRLVLVLGALLLAGCGSGKPGEEPRPAPDTAQREESSPPRNEPEKEVINPRVDPPEAGVLTPAVEPVLDILWREDYIPAERAAELAAAEVRPMTGGGGRLTLTTLRLTTFRAAGRGGEYLPPDTPVWEVKFAGDGRLWQPTSGPAVLDPSQAYSHAVIVESADVLLNTESGKVIGTGVSGGPLQPPDNLEHYRGTLLSTEGERLTLALTPDNENAPESDGSAARSLTVVIPRNAELVRKGSAGGAVESTTSFAEVISSPPGTPVEVWGLTFAGDAVVAYRVQVGPIDEKRRLFHVKPREPTSSGGTPEVSDPTPGVYVRIGGRTYTVRGLPTHQEELEACRHLDPTNIILSEGDSNAFSVGTRVYLRPGFPLERELWVFDRTGECVRLKPGGS